MRVSDIEVTLVDSMGSDLSVVNAARVSFNKESEWEWEEIDGSDELVLSKSDSNLINYLAKNKHFSPFNHSFITCRVKAPMFVARQLVKHKFMPWNEVSRRYVDDEPEFYFPEFWRKKAKNVKQGSSDEEVEFGEDHQYAVVDQTSFSLSVYHSLLKGGVCAEQARMVLPMSTMTEWIWSGTLGAYADMLTLRLDPHTQYESRIVAEKIKEKILPLFPISLAALLESK